MSKFDLTLKKYITVCNNIKNLENLYRLKYKNKFDYSRLVLLEEIEHLKTKRHWLYKFMIQTAKEG